MDRTIITEEEALYDRVRAHLAEVLVNSAGREGLDRELISLRDQIAEARLEDVAPLVEEMYRTAALAAQRGRGVAPPPDPASPYFGHMVLREEARGREPAREREVLLGKRTHINSDAGVTIVDWRNAPISRIFYRYMEGDEYEEQIAGRASAGELVARRTLSIHAGVLRRISHAEAVYVRQVDGTWTRHETQALLAGGQRTATRPSRVPRSPRGGRRRARPGRDGLGVDRGGVIRPDKHLPEIAALIDPRQFDLITRDVERVVILRGGAGSGKTTVALHRIAYLAFADHERFRPRHMMVIVPQRGLVEYVSRVLPSLEVDGVAVHTFTGWARRTRRRMLPRLKWKVAEDPPDAVAAVKKHPALLGLIDELVAGQAAALDAELASALAQHSGGEAIIGAFRRAADQPIAARVTAARKAAYSLGGRERDAVFKLLAMAQRRVSDVINDWADLLTDGERLTRATADWPEAPSPDAIASTVRHVLAQIENPEEQIALLDPERRTGVDGHGEEDGLGHRLDACDEPLLLRLWQVKHGALTTEGGRPIQYDHVAVDEAQDLSALDLRVLIDATRGSAVTLAGDMAQKVVFDNGFKSWEQLLRALGSDSAAVETLGLSYRSTLEIMKVAHAVLGPLAPPEAPVCNRDGVPVDFFRYSDAGEAVAFLAEALRSLMGRERAANVAVLARFAAQADVIYQGLRQSEVPHLRRVVGGDFSFSPGVDVTDVASAKGLEYDYVVLVDVDAASYPESVECQHLLHVAVTRAVHQLWITCAGPPSPLLPSWLTLEE